MHTPRFDFLSVKSRIYTGFAVVCILLVVVGVISYFGLFRTKNHFINFTKLSEQAILHVNIGRNVTELQRQSLRFTYEGHEMSESNVYSLHDILEKDLRVARQTTLDRKSKLIIDKMIEHLDIYINTFKEVVTERKLRNNLVQKELRGYAEKSEDLLLKYIQIESKEGHLEHSTAARLLVIDLLNIEKSAFRYFDFLDSTLIAAALENFDGLKAGIGRLLDEEKEENRDGNKVRPYDIESLVEANDVIQLYEHALLRAVQATRAYLYLVNVVMAGEASEFLYNADKLNGLATGNMLVIRRQLIEIVKGTMSIMIIITISALVFGIVISWIVGRSITIPVSEITDTFKLLTKGVHEAEIPGSDDKDEIGDLSRAAEVFKHKNRETELLLEKSNVLTGELEVNRKELARSNDELEQFVYTVSHDLKAPLVTSMGYISMIKDLAGRGELKNAINKLDRVVNANTRMGQLINDLLELSRVGRTELSKRLLDMNIILESLKDTLANKLEKEKIELKLDMEFPTIFANESRVFQVFENIMSNALKYGKPLSGESTLKIGSKENSGEYLFCVVDDGMGIPKEYQDRIFELFYRLDSAADGTGIGLAIVNKIMQSHGGRVWVESDGVHGSTFWLAFPKKTINMKGDDYGQSE